MMCMSMSQSLINVRVGNSTHARRHLPQAPRLRDSGGCTGQVGGGQSSAVKCS